MSAISPDRGHAALRRYRVSLPAHLYHVTTATRARRPVFAEWSAARAAIRAMHQANVLRDSRLLAWTLMPDHLHALVELGSLDSVGALARRVKSASAHAVNRLTGISGALWQAAYHEHLLRADESALAVARYIVANPLRAGLVRRVADYPHWDCVWLEGW